MQTLFSRYGESLTVEQPAGTVTACGFVQCPQSHRIDLPVDRTPLGTIERRQWYYFGDTAVTPEDRMIAQVGVFRIKESGTVQLGGKPVFYRAVLMPEREAVQ